MTTFFVSRHPGAIEWAARHGIAVGRQVAHLDVAEVKAGDVVIGTLRVDLAAEACARGARYFNLSLDITPEARGAGAFCRRSGALWGAGGGIRGAQTLGA